jgi:hypothetical protein
MSRAVPPKFAILGYPNDPRSTIVARANFRVSSNPRIKDVHMHSRQVSLHVERLLLVSRSGEVCLPLHNTLAGVDESKFCHRHVALVLL